MIGVGAGVGLRKWTYEVSPNNVGHVYGEARGFFSPTKVSLYYRLKAGYGNSIGGSVSRFRSGFDSSDGGLYLSPGIGIRFLGNSQFQLNLETGLNHQRITYYGTDFGSVERNYKFNPSLHWYQSNVLMVFHYSNYPF